jgi:hypothetical protein
VRAGDANGPPPPPPPPPAHRGPGSVGTLLPVTFPDVAPVPAPPGEEPAVDTTFDRDRVLSVIDRLEREVAVVEAAMVHVESGAHDAAEIALASLDTPSA